MQIDHPRWPWATFPENMNMTISQEPINEFESSLYQNGLCMKFFFLNFFLNDHPRLQPSSFTVNSINMKQPIPHDSNGF